MLTVNIREEQDNMKNKKRLLSVLILTAAAMIWGFAFTAQKAADSVPALTLNGARSLIAALFLFILIPVFDRIFNTGRKLFGKSEKSGFTKAELIGGAVCGAILALATFFQQFGLNAGTDAGKASFITALYVVLVPIYALFLKKRAPVNVWLSMPIAILGFYLLCIRGDFGISRSDIFVVVCALIFPIHILTVDKFSPKCDGVRMSFVQFLTSGILSMACALIFESPISFSGIAESILPILYLGIGSSGIAYTLQIIGQKGVNPAAASLLLSLESVFGVIGSALFLGEVMSTREYLGCIAVFAAVVLSQLDLKLVIAARGKAASTDKPDGESGRKNEADT